MRYRLLSLVAVLAFGISGAAQAATIAPAVEYDPGSSFLETLSEPFTLGYSFILSAPVTVNALGYWDDGQGDSHQVGIWDFSSGTLLASTTVSGTDPQVGFFRWATIADVELDAGSYIIGGEFFANSSFPNAFPGTVTTIPEYVWVQAMWADGTGLNQPNVPSLPRTSSLVKMATWCPTFLSYQKSPSRPLYLSMAPALA